MDLPAAAKTRSFRKALELIAEGADVNAPGARGETALKRQAGVTRTSLAWPYGTRCGSMAPRTG